MNEEISKEVAFTEILATDEQNGYDCGFLALSVTRKEIINYLLLHQDSEEIRSQLAPEVQNFLFEECSSIENEKVLMGSVIELLEMSNGNPPKKGTQGSQDIKDNQCLAKFSALLIKEQHNITEARKALMELNEILGSKEGPKPLSKIASIHGNHSNLQVVTLINQIFEKQNELKNEILEFASSKAAYIYYLENYYQKEGWMAFQRSFGEAQTSSIIDVIADMKEWQIMVWMPILRKEPNILQCLYSTKSATKGTDIPKEIHHIKFNGINHFTKLEPLEPSSFFDIDADLNVIFTGRVIPSTLLDYNMNNNGLEIEVNNGSNLMIFQDLRVSCMNPDIMFEHSSSDFEKLVQSSVFVDKSLFIKRALEQGRTWVITRPRRWGKTLNLKMLQKFLETDDPDLPHNSQNLKYFIGGEHEKFIYRKLQIAECKSIMDKYQGKHPVVFVTFKDVLVESFDGTEIAQIRNRIKALFREVFETKLYLEERLRDQLDIDRWNRIRRCEEEDLCGILPFLGTLLKKIHQKDVFLLVDEHDRCLNDIIHERAFIQKNDKGMQDLVSSASRLISHILSPCIKDSTYYYRAVVTGIYNTIYTEAGSGVNNVTYSSIEDYHFKHDFGLSKSEIEVQLLNPIFKQEDQNKTQEKEIILKIMEVYYNGYSMPSSFEEDNLSVYVPFPVISFVLDIYSQKMIPGKPKSYWSASGSSEVIKNLSSIQCDETAFDQLFQLSQGKSVLFERNVQSLSLVDAFSTQCKYTLEEIVFYLLINGGYVTRVNPKENYWKIPNREILEYFSESVLTAWVQQKGVKIEAPDLCKLGEVIGPNLSQIEDFQNALKDLLKRLPPGIREEPEFQALIYGGVMDYAIYRPKDATHKASLEKYARNEKKELGKIETILFPMKANLNLIIHEYKVYRTSMNEENIQRLQEHAIWQIFVRHYMEEGLNRRAYINTFEKVELRGIVFFENDVNGGWDVSIKLVVLTIEEAKNIVQFFNDDQTKQLRNVFSNREDSATKEAKAELLKICGVNDLNSLIESLKNPQSEPPNPDKMQIEDEESKKPDIEETIRNLFKNQNIKVRKETDIIQYIIQNRKTMIQSSNADFKKLIQKNISGVGPKSVSHLEPIIDQIKQMLGS